MYLDETKHMLLAVKSSQCIDIRYTLTITISLHLASCIFTNTFICGDLFTYARNFLNINSSVWNTCFKTHRVKRKLKFNLLKNWYIYWYSYYNMIFVVSLNYVLKQKVFCLVWRFSRSKSFSKYPSYVKCPLCWYTYCWGDRWYWNVDRITTAAKSVFICGCISTIKKPSPIVQYFNIEFANANKKTAVTTG